MGTVAFTGYRPNKLPFAEDKKDELYLAFRKRLRQVIDRLVERGYTEYVSGVASKINIIPFQSDNFTSAHSCKDCHFNESTNIDGLRIESG